MKDRRKFRIAFGVIAGLVAFSLGMAVLFSFQSRGALAGELRHDFGVVSVPPGGTDVQHVFELINRTSHALAIKSITPTCGCTKVEPSTQNVAPGAALNVSVDFHLEGTGKKFANIHIDLGEDGITTLTVAATKQPATERAKK